MDNKVFGNCAVVLKYLTSDFFTVTDSRAKEFVKELIIEKARQLVKVADEIAETTEPKKSELPCNCKREEKKLAEILAETAERVKDTDMVAVVIADKKVLESE